MEWIVITEYGRVYIDTAQTTKTLANDVSVELHKLNKLKEELQKTDKLKESLFFNSLLLWVFS